MQPGLWWWAVRRCFLRAGRPVRELPEQGHQRPPVRDAVVDPHEKRGPGRREIH